MTSPQPDNDAQRTPGDPATDPTLIVPPNQQHGGPGQYAFGVQPPAPGVPPMGWQTPPGYGPQPAYWPQAGPGYDQHTAPGYGAPPAYGYGGYGQPGYGQSPYGPGGYQQSGNNPSGGQIALWVTLGAVAFLGLLGAILSLTLLMDLTTAVSRASQICNQYGGGPLSEICKQSLRNHGVKVPVAAVIYLALIILGSAVALGGAVMMLLRKYFGQFLILGGGIVMLLFAIVCAAQYGGPGRLTYDLIAGVLIAIAGGLLLVPQIRLFLTLPISGPRPGPFGAGGQQPYGQPYPGPYGQPGSGGYPPRQW
ncbi:MAG: hypothetical protein ACRDTV_16495 [Mycobacterium sp.]